MNRYRTIVEPGKNINVIDVFSKLIQNRIIFIDGVIDDEFASEIVAQLLYLDSVSHDEISIYINSPGGQVNAGLAIYDFGKLVKSSIKTVCVGVAASMGAILMLLGEKRLCTKHSRIMFHQPSGGVLGTSSEIKIYFDEIESLKQDLYSIIKERTLITNPEELYSQDKWYNSKQCLEYGIVTEIL